MYSLNFENRCLILYVKVYVLVRFIFVSMSHIFICIYSYGFYLDLIGYIEFQFWLYLILFSTCKNQNLILCMQYHSFTRIWVRIIFLFHPFKTIFYLFKDNDLFSPLSPSTIVFSTEFIDFLIAHKCDHLFGSLLPSEVQSQAFIFSQFGWLHYVFCKMLVRWCISVYDGTDSTSDVIVISSIISFRSNSLILNRPCLLSKHVLGT